MCCRTSKSFTVLTKITSDIFEEAFSHCRWTTALSGVVEIVKANMEQGLYINKTFDDIIMRVYSLCRDVKGLGMLSAYDIASAICRFYSINIDKVYIIGGGPRRAVKLLDLKTKKHIVSNDIKINYVEVVDLLQALSSHNVELERELITSTNGDLFETFICIWQKGV